MEPNPERDILNMKSPSLKPNLKSQNGQVIIEYVLMMVVMLGVSMLLQKYIGKGNFIQNFTVKPWARLDGMVQCGTWSECGIDVKKGGLHPNSRERVLSLDSANLQ